jgi:Putative beta-barrel porin 2
MVPPPPPRITPERLLVMAHRRSIEFALLVCAVHPLAALAETTFKASAGAEYAYDSNVFDVRSGSALPGLNPASGDGDTYQSYSAEFDLGYQSAQQKLHADVSGSDFRYQKFTQLNRQEYKLDAGWTGTFWSAWDGSFDVVRDRAMVPFLDLTQTQTTLTMTTMQREDAGLGVQFLPRWRAEANGYVSDTDWPLPGEPNLQLKESEGEVLLKYLGTGPVTSGLRAAYTTGTYSGATGSELNTSYRQWSAGIVANYASGHSTLAANLSYTDRTAPRQLGVLNSLSGTTAALRYTNQITGKTSLSANLTRVFTPYITNQGTTINNIANVTLSWQATYRIHVVASYEYDYAEFPGQGNNPLGSDRLDHLQSAKLGVEYAPRPWLLLKPYASYQTRTSNIVGGNFDASVYGVKLTLTFQ